METPKITLKDKGNSVYNKRNYWLVLTRTSLAGFNAPIDSVDVLGREVSEEAVELIRKTARFCQSGIIG